MRLIAEWTMLDLRRRWRSLLALALLVAVAAATVLTAMAGARRGETAFARLWARTSPATVTVLPNQPGFDWARIRALPEVAALATFAVSAFEVVGHPELSQDSSFPLGSTSILRTIEHPVVLQGRLVSPGRADEVDVTPLVPRNFGVGVGGTLQLRLATAAQIDQGHGPYNGYPALGRVITVHVVGVVRSPWFSDGVGSVGSVIPSPALMARYRPDIVGSHAEVYVNALVRLKGGASAIPRFRAALARVTGRPDIQVWNNWQNFGEQVVRTTGYEAACLLAFGLAALAAAVFLIGQSVARYCSAAIADLQLLRAPGITPRQASASAAAGPLLAAVAGGTLGVAGAILASNWMPIGAASYAEPSPGISADWLVLGPGWAAVPVLVLAGALASAARAQAAARTQREPRRSAVAATALAAGVPVPMLVGTRFALEPGRGRSALPVRPALAGAVAGVLGVLAAFTFSAGITHAAANPALFGQTFQLEAFTGLDSRSPRPVAPVLRAVAASREVASEEDVRSAIAQSGAVSLTVYAGRPVGGKPLPVTLTAGRMPAGSDGIVLAPTTAGLLHARVGSQVRLTGRGPALTATVTGLGFVPIGPHNDYDTGGWMTPAGYGRLFGGTFLFRFSLVALTPGVAAAAAAGQLHRLAGSVRGGGAIVFAPPTLPEQIYEVRDVTVLPFALGGFLALLALGAVGHALATAVRRRRGELAVLRALGITRTQSRLVVITQASVLAVAGLAFGVPLGVVAGRVAWRLVAHSTPLAYRTPVAAVALSLIVPAALVLANLLAAWPGQRAARLRSAQILRAE